MEFVIYFKNKKKEFRYLSDVLFLFYFDYGYKYIINIGYDILLSVLLDF